MTTTSRPTGNRDNRAGAGGSAYVDVMVTCDHCGRMHEGETPPLTWSTAVERGQRRCFCEDCSRRHLRAMESKLDSEWW